MREFVKRFSSGWVGWVLGAITILSVLSIALTDIPWGFTVVAVLLIALRKSYQLFTEQQREIMQQKDEVWSARHGTSLFIRIKAMPVMAYRTNHLAVQEVYIANRRKDHTANVRFTLVAGDERLEAEGYESDGTRLGMDLRLPNPKHIGAGENYTGYLEFPFAEADDLTPLVVEGVLLEIRDEQTGFTAEIELPTDSDGVELIERREDG